MEELPHLEKIGWNFKEEIVLTTRQHCTDDNVPVITYYQYDGGGQRIRKITENQANAGATPTKKEERIYVAGYELYKKHSGTDTGLERVSLSLMDEGHRFVMVETRNEIDDGTEKQLVRYQLHNHLGSAALELDGTPDAKVISYEEYHPFGTTAYQAKNKDIKAAAKRYRYTGMERDEETGLEYHSARYYLPWLGRWCSADPIGIGDGVNVYGYVGNRPIIANDDDGTQSKPVQKPFVAPTVQESGGLPTTQTITYDGRKVDVEFIPGISGETILIVGGVHQDEKQGKLLAKELFAKLRSEQQYYNIIIIPDLFGHRGVSDRDIDGKTTNTGNFPNQNETLADAAKRGGGTPLAATVDSQGTAVRSPEKMLPENVILVSLLEKYKSQLVFTLSIHDHSALNLSKTKSVKGKDVLKTEAEMQNGINNGAPGFFLDQKAGGDSSASQLAKDVVTEAEKNGVNVDGNYLGTMVNGSYVRGSLTSDYPNATAKQSKPGVSFGTYGSSLGINQYLVEASKDGKRRSAMVNAMSDKLINPVGLVSLLLLTAVVLSPISCLLKFLK